MPLRLRNLILFPGESEGRLREELLRRYDLADAQLLGFRLVRKSIDARSKGRVKFICTVEFSLADEASFLLNHDGDDHLQLVSPPEPHRFPQIATTRRIIIAGMGPAGLFAALRLAEYGMTALILERGKPVETRLKDVQTFWSRGVLDPESNVQFGEGGAGTFSDGKLTTRVNDPEIAHVLEQLVRFGAPAEILTVAKPHIGTDRLRGVVSQIRQHLMASGFEICFQHCLTDLVGRQGKLEAVVVNGADELACDDLILAPGHSARDTYALLHLRSIALEQKPFAIGLRVEHPQELISRIQYGAAPHPALPPADYSLAYNNPRTGRSAYSFCMCPGGVVVAGASEAGGVVTNGMSNHLRNSPRANSALVVNVRREDFASASPLAGIEFQRSWEQRAYVAGGGDFRAPSQNLLAFLGERPGREGRSSYRPGTSEVELATVLPGFVSETLREGIRFFERKMRGFVTGEAVLTGVETRTSAPVRIVRGVDFQSISLRGLYPAGEGAGYAGGIMSAALDGIRVADAIARQCEEQIQA